MKVKSLLLSMCAIAALASCSQNDDEVPGGNESNAPEAKVIIKLAGNGDQPTSRVAGLPTNDALATSNSMVNNLTVFIFNNVGTVITKSYIASPQAVGANSVTTTTDATEVAVVANTGDQTGTGGLFTTVATKDALKAVLANMLTDTSNPAAVVTQTDANLYMSGRGMLSAFAENSSGDMTASVSVQLHYLSARIQLSAISFNGKTVQDNKYVQAGGYDADADANFTITKVYLMNVQRATQVLPTTDDGADYIAQSLKEFTGGVAWSAPWTGTEPNQFKPNSEYVIEAGTDKFIPGSGAAANRISDIGHWYTFANTGVADITNHPTALVVEVKWRKVKANATVTPAVAKEEQTLYFTTYFGGGDQAELEPGKVYTVKLALNGNFKPADDGGSGGGGTTDPTKPTVNSSVEVTVVPATWVLAPEISKEWV